MRLKYLIALLMLFTILVTFSAPVEAARRRSKGAEELKRQREERRQDPVRIPTSTKPVDPNFFTLNPYPGYEYQTYGFKMVGGWMGTTDDWYDPQTKKMKKEIGRFAVEWDPSWGPDDIRIILGIERNLYTSFLMHEQDMFIPFEINIYGRSNNLILNTKSCMSYSLNNYSSQFFIEETEFSPCKPWHFSQQEIKTINNYINASKDNTLNVILKFGDYYDYFNIPSSTPILFVDNEYRDINTQYNFAFGFSLWKLKLQTIPLFSDAKNSIPILKDNVTSWAKICTDYVKLVELCLNPLIFYVNALEAIKNESIPSTFNTRTDGDYSPPLFHPSLYIPIVSISHGYYTFYIKPNTLQLPSLPKEFTTETLKYYSAHFSRKSGPKLYDRDFPDEFDLDLEFVKKRFEQLQRKGGAKP